MSVTRPLALWLGPRLSYQNEPGRPMNQLGRLSHICATNEQSTSTACALSRAIIEILCDYRSSDLGRRFRLRIFPLIVHPKPVGRARANFLLELARVQLRDPGALALALSRFAPGFGPICVPVVGRFGEHVQVRRV